MNFSWNEEKNKQLKSTRGISFERIIVAIEEGSILDIVEHHNKKKYPNQKIIIVNIESYAICVPCVISEKEIFLKTIFPSRRYTRKYQSRGEL